MPQLPATVATTQQRKMYVATYRRSRRDRLPSNAMRHGEQHGHQQSEFQVRH